MSNDVVELQAKLNKAIKALSFYADESNWLFIASNERIRINHFDYKMTEKILSKYKKERNLVGGQIARNALREIVSSG